MNAGVTLAPGQSYLFANTNASGGYSGTVTPDQTYGTGITDFSSSNFAGIRLVDAGGTVVDGVGSPSSPCREGTGFTTPNSPTTGADLSFERFGGSQDTDSNAADFTGPKGGNPQAFGPTGGDAAPSVASSTPADGTADVGRTANVTVTFSEPVVTSAANFSISCDVSGSHLFTFSGGPTTYTLDPDAEFAEADTCTVTVDAAGVADADPDDPPNAMAADHRFTFSTVAPTRRIFEIQGAEHVSTYAGKLVSGVPGVITAVRPNSFYMQDAVGDGVEATSDAILVFVNRSTAGLSVGQAVNVSGRVTEFRPGCPPATCTGGSAFNNLTTTEITSPTVTPAGPGATIAPTVIGEGGRVPPATVIEDDVDGSVEMTGVFDPATDGIDFYESLEAMRLRVNDPVVVGPTNDFGEVWVLVDNGAGAGLRTIRGGIVIRPTDFNPERIQLDDEILATPDANVGDRFTGPLTGVLDYNFGNFEILLTSALTRVDQGLEREVARPQAKHELAVATFNVENLDPTDSPAKFAELADLIVENLQSPDIIGVEEVQDNNGASNDSVTDATLTYQALIGAIQAADGPTYEFRQVDPVDDQDGGQGGGNIRVGFLFRTDRGLSFVDRAGATPTTANVVLGKNQKTQLQYSPGRIDPTNTAFANSRKPLAAEFRFHNQTIFAIVNHFNSKGGDQPLFGRFQPPARSSEVQRKQQAQIVNDFVDELLAADGNALIVVLGDLNDFEFSQTLEIVEGGVLTNLMELLPADERYSYVFEGNSQVLDQILVSDKLLRQRASYDVVHANAEFFDQASDHEPQVARFGFSDVGE